jgi:thiamine biosynthesis lipoprotein
MIERRFRAMGSDAHVIVVGGPNGLVDTAAARIEDLEAKWSRFRPSSEVCRLTAAAGAWVDVSADTTLLVRRSIDAWYLTGASFDPTVLGAMLDAGYDRTFETLRTAGGEPVDVRRPRFSLVGCTDIGVEDRRVRLPADCGFDAGGIGKGLAADLVAEELMAAGAEGVLMSLGGDLRVDASPPTAAPGPSRSTTRTRPNRSCSSAFVGAPSPRPPRCGGDGPAPMASSTTSSIRSPVGRRSPMSDCPQWSPARHGVPRCSPRRSCCEAWLERSISWTATPPRHSWWGPTDGSP